MIGSGFSPEQTPPAKITESKSVPLEAKQSLVQVVQTEVNVKLEVSAALAE
jgi:hypothetical protein